MSCFDSVLSNIPLNMSLGGIHTLQVSYSNTNTSVDSVLSNNTCFLVSVLISLALYAEFLFRQTHWISIELFQQCFKQYYLLPGMCSRFYTIFSMQNFCFDKPIGIALSCFDSVLSNNACFLVCSRFCTISICWISVSTNPLK